MGFDAFFTVGILGGADFPGFAFAPSDFAEPSTFFDEGNFALTALERVMHFDERWS